MPKISADEIERRFTYHPPSPERAELHRLVRNNLMAMAVALATALPEGREASLAITRLEEVMFWANAAIARETA